MFKKLKLKIPTLMLVLLLGSVSAFCQNVFNTLQTQVNDLSTNPTFANVLAVDTKVTEAAAADLITAAQFEQLDAIIRTKYRNSTNITQTTVTGINSNTTYNSDQVIVWSNNSGTNNVRTITINNSATVVFIANDDDITQTIKRSSNNTGKMIVLSGNATLIIKGSPDHKLILDGGATISSNSYQNGAELSECTMTSAKTGQILHLSSDNTKLMVSNATFQNNYCEATGSGIRLGDESADSYNLKTVSFFQTDFFNLWTIRTSGAVYVGGAIISRRAKYQNITLADGSTVHGILMNHCHFKGNRDDESVSGIQRTGGSCFAVQGGTLDLRMKNSLVESSYSPWHGGAIFWNISDGTLDLNGTTFKNNCGGLGGAVYVQGNLTLSNCRFEGNYAKLVNSGQTNYFAGNGYDGCGGALYVQPSDMTGQGPTTELNLNSCVFDGNHADVDGGAITLFMVRNTNVSGHQDIAAEININGTSENMLIQNNTAGRLGGALALTMDPDLYNRLRNNTDALEADIHMNGGKLYKNEVLGSTVSFSTNPPFTETGHGGGMFLYCKYAKSSVTGQDPVQIGDGFEIAENTAAKDGGAIYVADGNVTAGDMLAYGNNTVAGNGGAICVNGGNFTMNKGVLGTETNPNIANGNGGGVYVHDGNEEGGNVTINGGIISYNEALVKNSAGGMGGGFYTDGGTITIKNSSEINGNQATNGGGFYAAGGDITITSSEISGNEASADGGGVYSNGGAITITNGEIESNEAVNGGGVYSNGGDITITGATIADNSANDRGGGIYSNGGTLAFESGSILRNIASNINNIGQGGGGYINGGELTIDAGNIDDNTALNGGGFYINGGTLNLKGGTIGQPKGNHALFDGGGFYMRGGTANITDGIVEYNDALNNGGGLYMAGTDETHKCVANFSDGTFMENEAMNGGGIYLADYAELYMSGASAVTDNHAVNGGRGGGIFKQGGNKSLLWVSGTELQITGNYLGDTYSSATRNNAFLYDYDDFITVDPVNSISDGVKVGVSVRVNNVYEDLPTPVIYCEDDEKVNDIFYMLKEATGDNGIFDDAKKYTAVYTSSPEPFNDNQIFFVSTWASFNEQPEGFSIDNIDSPEDLAYFMTLVNGTNVGSEGPQSNLNGTVTADIDMSGDNWVPIGEYDHNDTDISQELAAKYFYSGTFEGNGHTISGLKTMGLIGYYNYGMFGMTHGATIRNVVLADCEFVSGECARMANLIGEMTGGVAENCIVSGTLNPSGSETIDDNVHSCVVGGLVGETINNAVIRNSISTADIEATAKTGSIYPGMQAYTVGGLVGMTSAGTVIENCFANSEIHHSGSNGSNTTLTSWDRYVGGLIGENYGIVKNCYVRLQRDNQLTTTQSGGNKISKFGMFAGYNGGTVDHCFYPNSSLRNANINTYGADLYYSGHTQGTSANHGQYNTVILPYTYTSYLKDNQVMMDNESAYGTEEATTLLSRLNDWVDAQTTSENYSQWMRTKASDVNADYPVLSYDNIISTLNYTTVGSKDGIRLEYDNSFNDIYDRFAAETEPEGCLFVYRTPWSGTISSPVSEFITADNSDNDIKVYVEDGVALLQNADSKLVNTYTCQEFDDASRSWHLISSSLNEDSPIGFNYTNYSEYNENPNPCGASVATGSYKSFFPQGIPMADLDLYCFYETEYHWINFKRRTDSHWHMNDRHQNIVYENETSLVPGKGYLASFAGRTLLQAGGELTSGDITIPVTIKAGSLNASANPAIPANEGTELKGYNLLANPYQSYLDLDAFLTVNSGLFSGSSKSGALIPTYAVYDPEKGAYVQGMASTPSRGSYAPTGTLGMHEGFFIVAANSGKDAKFTNAMRLDKATSSAKRAEQPAYPLVNLMVADASGDNDIAVVEFGRPQVEGAAKMMNIGANGKVYFHYNGDDCALLYLDDATDHLPVHFDALEDGTYTMTWSTANATFSYLHLIDNMTGMDIDMLTSDGYTFTSNSSDYKSRFKMMFAYTGVEENGAAETETFAFMHDGNLVVNGEGWLEVIDLCGRTIASTKLTNAQNTMSLPQAAQGVYVLKLTSNNMTKVQKIVVE